MHKNNYGLNIRITLLIKLFLVTGGNKGRLAVEKQRPSSLTSPVHGPDSDGDLHIRVTLVGLPHGVLRVSSDTLGML